MTGMLEPPPFAKNGGPALEGPTTIPLPTATETLNPPDVNEFEKPFPNLQERFKKLKEAGVGRVVKVKEQEVGYLIGVGRKEISSGMDTYDVILMLDNGLSATLKSFDATGGKANLKDISEKSEDLIFPKGHTRSDLVKILESGDNDFGLQMMYRTDRPGGKDNVYKIMDDMSPKIKRAVEKNEFAKQRKEVADQISTRIDDWLAPSSGPQPTATPASA